MKCKICDKKTTYDKSVGYDSFIVCNACHHALGNDRVKTLDFIFRCGKVAKERKKIK